MIHNALWIDLIALTYTLQHQTSNIKQQIPGIKITVPMENSLSKKYATVDEYISAQPENAAILLTQMRELIRQAAPQAVELVSYNMPAFKTNRILVYYAAHKAHIGLYPASLMAMNAFAPELTEYKTSKGAIQFPFDKGIPEALVEKIVRYRLDENEFLLKSKKKIKPNEG